MWSCADEFIFVCHLTTNHWIVLRACIQEWQLEVYDSLLHELKTLEEINHRTTQILPIARLFPRLLHVAHYWEQHPHYTKHKDEMQIKFLSAQKQFRQEDEHSCGPLVCLYLDRMLAQNKPKTTKPSPQ